MGVFIRNIVTSRGNIGDSCDLIRNIYRNKPNSIRNKVTVQPASARKLWRGTGGPPAPGSFGAVQAGGWRTLRLTRPPVRTRTNIG